MRSRLRVRSAATGNAKAVCREFRSPKQRAHYTLASSVVSTNTKHSPCARFPGAFQRTRRKLGGAGLKCYDDEVSWTTRTWSSLMAQRMSVALHMAAAWEIARELSLAGAEDEAALFGGGVADSVA